MERVKLLNGTIVLTSGIKVLSLCGNFNVHIYGLFAFLGTMVLFLLSSIDFQRKSILTFERHSSAFIWMLFGGIFGARLLNCVTNAECFISNPVDIFKVWDGGLSLMGGVFGIILVTWIFTKVYAINFLAYADLIAIYAPIMQAISRLGCFFAGCCYGAQIKIAIKKTLSVVYQNPNSLAPNNVNLYPVQLYSALLSFLIFVFLFLLSRYKKFEAGTLFFLYLLLEGLARSYVDIYRGNRTEFFLNIINLSTTVSQSLAFIMALVGLLGIVWTLLNKTETSNNTID